MPVGLPNKGNLKPITFSHSLQACSYRAMMGVSEEKMTHYHDFCETVIARGLKRGHSVKDLDFTI